MAGSHDEDTSPAPKARRNWAPKRTSPLSKECAARQGEITTLAFRLLGGRDQAIAFLNEPDEQLGGRPLDIAMANKAGYERVAEMLKDRAGQLASIKG